MSDFPEKITMQGDISFNPNQSPNPKNPFGWRVEQQEYIRADLVTQWRPIETMPENVDVFLMTPKRVAYVGSFNGHYDIRLQSIPGLFDKTHFTHWMPIPKVPK